MARGRLASHLRRAVAGLLMAMVVSSAHGSRAAPIATVDLPVVALSVDVDTRTDVDGLQYTMTAVKDVPTGVQTIVGQRGFSGDFVVPAGSTVAATLIGPTLPAEGIKLTAAPNSVLELPRLARSGQYFLLDVRVEDMAGAVLFERARTLDQVVIEVIDELLVTEVTSRPLTSDELEERGIAIDEDNFSALSFSVGLTVGSDEVEIELPVIIPAAGSDAIAVPQVPSVGISGSTVAGLEQLDIPNFTVSGFTLDVPPEQQVPGFDLPPVSGVVIIPGNVAFLNQFFSVIVVATNVAPGGSGLVVETARATIGLPPGGDAIPATGDDPLGLATVTGGGNTPVQALLDAGGSDVVVPQGSNQAEYLVEGLREGTHRVGFDITGELFVPGLGTTVPVSGRAAGIVQVRNPTFSLILAHPQNVREGEEYSLFVTVTNTSQSPANFFQLTLDERSLSGALLAPGERGTKAIETLASGEADSFEYRLVARTTGDVTGTVALADEGVNGSFVLTTGVGASGIPLSPDTLILPQTVDHLPDQPDVVLHAVRLLGQAYSVATAPAGSLPPDVARVSKPFVFARAVRLAQAGLHVRLGESDPDAAFGLLMDLVGADHARLDELFGVDTPQSVAAARDLQAFDTLRRTSLAGRAVTDALGEVIGSELQAIDITTLHRSFAERFASRPAHLSVAVGGDGAPVYVRIVDPAGAAAGRLDGTAAAARQIPYAVSTQLAADASLVLVTDPSASWYDVELAAPDGANAAISLVVPFASGMAQVTYPLVPLPFGAAAHVRFEADVGGPFVLEIDNDGDGLTDLTVLPSTVVPIADEPPLVLGVRQWGKGDRPTTPLTFAGGDPLGRLVALLFSEEIELTGEDDAFVVDENAVRAAKLQPDNRVVFVKTEAPVGPFVAREVTATGVIDRRGIQAPAVPTLVQPDPELGAGGVVEGIVRAPNGTPVPFASIEYIQPVFCPECSYGLGTTNDRIASRITADAFGRYQLDFVLQNALVAENGDRWLNAQTSIGTDHFKLEALDPLTGNVGKASTRVLFDGQRMHLDVIIRGYGSIVGRVVDEDGAAVQGAGPSSNEQLWVEARNISTGEAAVGWVDDDATFAFPRLGDAGGRAVPMLAVGNVVLRVVRASDASLAVATANIPVAGAVVEQDLMLIPTIRYGSVAGRVLEADGQSGAPNVPVQVSAGGSPVGVTTTDAAGVFSFADIPAGDLELLTFRASTFEQARASAFLVEGAVASVNLILPGSGATVRGFVVDAVGDLVAGATVAGGPTLTSTDAFGYFEIPGLPLGSYTIYAQGPDSPGIGTQTVTLSSPTDAADVVIALEPVGSIAGTVYAADGNTPVAGQVVQLWVAPNDGVLSRTITSENGAYAFPAVPLGNYSVRAVVEDYGDGGSVATSVQYAGQPRVADIRFRGLGQVRGRVVQADGAPVLADVVIRRNVWRVQTAASAEQKETAARAEALLGDDPLVDMLAGTFLANFDVPSNTYYVLQREPVLLASDTLGPGGEVTGEFAFDGSITGGSFTVEAFGPFLSPAVVNSAIPQTTDPAQRVVDVGDIVLEASTGQVEGTVFLPDGLTPVGAGVRVALRSIGTNGSPYAPGVLPEIEAFTDELGIFRFPLVLTGPFTIVADTGVPDPGIAAGAASEIRTDVFDDADGNRVLNVRLLGQSNGVTPAGDVVIADVRLLDAAGVSVTILENDGSTPVPFAVVTLRTASTLDGSAEAGFVARTTDAAGTIELFPVIEGAFSVTSRDPATSASGTAAGRVPVDPPTGSIVPVAVTLGAVTSEQGDVVQARGFGTVRGTVFRADGTLLDNPTEVSVRGGGAFILTTSDPAGSFVAERVPAGGFTVDVFEPLTARRGSASGYLASDGDIAEVSVTLVGLGTVTGTVYENDGTQPVAGAHVTLLPSGSFSGPLVGTSNGQGLYTLPGVALGAYVVEATDPVSDTSGEATAVVSADGETETTDILLSATGSITGTVYDAGVQVVGGEPVHSDGSPYPDAPTVANASVAITGAGVTRTVQSDAAGSFDSGPYLPLGEYVIVARPPEPGDGGSARVSLEFHGEQAAALVALRGAGTVEGVVLDSLGQQPVDAARVTLVPLSAFSTGSVTRLTGPDGLFSIQDVPVGRFTIDVVTTLGSPQLGASASGVVALHGDTVAFYDDDTDLEYAAIWLQDAGEIRGSVVLSEGTTPVEGAVVELSGADLQLARLSDVSGAFTFPSLPLGSYSLSLLDPVAGGVAGRSATLAGNGQVVDLGPIALDAERPEVIATAPAAGATDVPPSSSIAITFSEPVDPATITPQTFRVSRGGQQIAGSRATQPSPPVATFTPSSPLPDRARIRVELLADRKDFDGTLVAAGIRDVAGLSLAEDFVFELTTSDATPPSTVSVSPAPGAIGVSADAVVRIELSESVAPASVGALQLQGPSGMVSGTQSLAFGDTVIIFAPGAALETDATYTATLPGPLTDLAGNPHPDATIQTTFSTVDTRAPAVTSLVAAGGVTPVYGTTLPIMAVVDDEADTSRVELAVDGVLTATGTTTPYAFGLYLDPSYGPTISVTARAVDAAGNRSAPATLDIAIAANQPPAAILVAPASGSVDPGQTVSVIVTGTDDAGVAALTYSAGAGAFGADTVSIDPPLATIQRSFSFVVPAGLAAGSQIVVRVAALDTLGSTSPDTAQSTATLTVSDNVLPAVSIGSPASGSAWAPGSTVSVFVQASDASSVTEIGLQTAGALVSSQSQVISPAQPNASATFQITVPEASSPTESVVLTASASDTQGNTGTSQITIGIADAVPPAVALSLAGGGTRVAPGSNVVIQAAVSDEVGVARVEVTAGAFFSNVELFGSAPTAATVSFSFTVPAGLPLGDTILVTGRTEDTSGNARDAAPLVLTVADLASPVVAILEPPSGSLVDPGATVQVRVQATDDFSLASLAFQTSGAVVASETHAVDLVGADAVNAESVFSFVVPAGAPPNAPIEINASATDQAGNSGTAAAVTVAVRDLVPPQLIATTPADGASEVPADTVVIATFDESLDRTTVDGSTVTLTGPSGRVPASVSFWGGDRQVRLTPSAALEFGATYVLSVTTAVTDQAGNPVVQPATASFTVVEPDTTPPTVVTVVPANGALGVDPNTEIHVVFSEPMAPDTLTAANIILQDDRGVIAGAVSPQNNDTEVLFVPEASLAVGTTHTIEVTTGVADRAGNPLAAPFSASFTSWVPDVDAPVVVWTEPANGAVDVATSSPVEVAFSEPIEPATVTAATFQVSASGSAIGGTFQFLDSGSRVRWLSETPLQVGAAYDVTLTADITDVAGNRLAAFAFSFVVVSEAPPDADADGVSDANELELGTDPGVADDFANMDIVIDGRSATLNGTLVLRSLSLVNGAVVTHSDATTTETFNLELRLESLSIDATSAIDTTARGYLGGLSGDNTEWYGLTEGNQPGAAGFDTTNGLAGGSHGGLGGARIDGSGMAPTYGSILDPRELGGGGGSGPYSNYRYSADGGGAVRIVAATISVDGAILCDGESSYVYGAGAAGGSVSIRTAVLAGSGTISANGGEATVVSSLGQERFWAGGGGGRIAIYFSDDSAFSGEVTAHGGLAGEPGGTQRRFGGAGTVYRDDTTIAEGSELIIDNGPTPGHPTLAPANGVSTLTNLVVRRASVTIVNPLSITGGELTSDAANLVLSELQATGLVAMEVSYGTIRAQSFQGSDIASTALGDGILEIGGRLESASIAMTGQSTLTHPPTTATQEFGLELVAGAMQVDANSAIDVSERGYLGGGRINGIYDKTARTLGNQPGATCRYVNAFSYSQEICLGGSYGGLGGPTFVDAQIPMQAVPTYGDLTDPRELGSGGAAGRYNLGGNGGGLVRISADTLHLDGSVRSNGGSGAIAAAGSGGGIRLDVGVLTGAGVIEANGGGDTYESEGGGGGGRIAIHFADMQGFAGSVEATGGVSRLGLSNYARLTGGAGTVYLHDLNEPYGDLVVDALWNMAGIGSTPLRSVGNGVVGGLEASSLYDSSGSFTVPDQATGALGLVGLELNPNVEQAKTFTIIGNTATTLFTDPADGDMTTVAAAGDAYSGVHTFSNIAALRYANIETSDKLEVVGTSFSVQSSFAWLQDVAAASLSRLELSNGTLSMGGVVVTENATISAGTLTHPPATTARTFSLELHVADTLAIGELGAVDVSAKGYLGGKQGDNADPRGRTLGNALGAGYAYSGNYSAASGSYGGLGGPAWADSTGGTVSPAYGDLTAPSEPGSGGATTPQSSRLGGNGGGLIRISAGTVQLDGAIRANGGTAYSAGAGSGGGVLIDADTLSGSGSIEANGGSDTYTSYNRHSGGGGGRIAVHFGDATAFTGTVSAAGAAGGTGTTGRRLTGGAGTVFWHDRSQADGVLIVGNAGNLPEPDSTPLRAIGRGTSTSLAAESLTDLAATFPVPNPLTGALGLVGLELDPSGGAVTFTVVDNTSTTIFIDPADGDMTSVALPGVEYIGVYTFAGLEVTGGAQVITADRVILLGPATVDGTSSFTSNNLSLP